MIECLKMKMETRQLILIKLLYIVCVLRTAISLEDQPSPSATVTNGPLDEPCAHCYTPLTKQQLQPDIYQQNVSYTSNHRMSAPPLDLINNSSGHLSQRLLTEPSLTDPTSNKMAAIGLDETNSRSIYASLMKILNQLKNQMKNSSSAMTQESSTPSEFPETAETIVAPITVVDQLRRSAKEDHHDWSLKNGLADEKRFHRADTSKQQRSAGKRRSSRYDTLPTATFSTSTTSSDNNNQQEPSTKSSQLNINFDDNNSNSNSNNNANSQLNSKRSSYSKYLGPTIDLTTAAKLRSDRKLNQQLNMDNNWYPNEDYSPSSRPSDEVGLSGKAEIQPDSPMPVYTTPGAEYLPLPSTLAPVNDNPVYHPFKSSPYSLPLPDVKPSSLDQALRETTTIATTTTENPEPTILLVRRQRNHGPYKKTKSSTHHHHKSSASHRDTIHLAQHNAANVGDSSLPYEHPEDPEAAPQSIKSSSSNFGEFGEELFRPKSTNHPILLQQLDSRPSTAHSPNHYSNGQYLQPQPSANHKVYYTLTSIPQSDVLKTMMPVTAASQLKSVQGTRSQRDLMNQPQTIQITSVPGGNAGALMRVNAANLGGLFGSGLDFSGGLPGLPGLPGRQVLMVNSDRRIDWSWIIWPMAVVVALPLVLSALFVPVFLKSIIIFIQILQSLGLVMPPSGLAHHFTSGASNLTSLN